MKTVIRKSMNNGWMAESMTEPNANGKAYEIKTYKSGKSVVCYTHEVTVSGDIVTFNCSSKNTILASEVGLCNEKRVAEVHAKGIENFNIQFADILATKVYPIEVGQVIFTYGYENQFKRVVYEVLGGSKYKTVSLDGKLFRTDNHVESYAKKHGIGVYYHEGDILPISKVNILVEAATFWQEMQAYKQKQAAIKADEYQTNAILKGSEIISSIPTDAPAIIVAELQQDESDGQSDYYASKTIKTVYLSFSNHKRNNFNELKNAAKNFDGTSHYYNGGSDIEHRENYSGGSGYYLGKSKYSGWIIRKFSTSPQLLEKLQIAAFENRFFCETHKLVTA